MRLWAWLCGLFGVKLKQLGTGDRFDEALLASIKKGNKLKLKQEERAKREEAKETKKKLAVEKKAINSPRMKRVIKRAFEYAGRELRTSCVHSDGHTYGWITIYAANLYVGADFFRTFFKEFNKVCAEKGISCDYNARPFSAEGPSITVDAKSLHQYAEKMLKQPQTDTITTSAYR